MRLAQKSQQWNISFSGDRHTIRPPAADIHVNYGALGFQHVLWIADITTFSSLSCCTLHIYTGTDVGTC